MSAVESVFPEDGFVSFGTAARHVGIAEPTLRRKIREAGLTVYTSSRDRRRKFLRVSDVEQFRTLVAVVGTGEEAPHAA